MTEMMTKVRKITGAERDEARLAEIMSKMRGWSELSEDVGGKLPAAIIAAVASGRPELLHYANDQLDRMEARTLLELVRVLLETNQALQTHAEELGKMSMTLSNDLRGLITKTLRIHDFAHFRARDEEGGEYS